MIKLMSNEILVAFRPLYEGLLSHKYKKENPPAFFWKMVTTEKGYQGLTVVLPKKVNLINERKERFGSSTKDT